MSSSPRLSVIIPAYRSSATLPGVLAALRPQIGSDSEVLVIESSGLDQAAELERSHPWVRVIGQPERVLPGAARNIGAQTARGSALAFLDSDALPDRAWLGRLRSYLENGSVAVAGAVRNGTPTDLVGTASYLLEFSEWTPNRRGQPRHGATCNLLVDRGAFEAAGGFCEDMWPGEDTVLTVPWGRARRLEFARDALVWHMNRTGLRELVRHQHRLGRAFAMVCDRVDFPHGDFSYWPLLSLAPTLRLVAMGMRLSSQPRLLRKAAALSPLVVLGLTAWAAGVAAERGSNGYEAGSTPYEAGSTPYEAGSTPTASSSNRAPEK